MDRHPSTKSNFLRSSNAAKYRFVSCRLEMDQDSRPPIPSFWPLGYSHPCNIIIPHKIRVFITNCNTFIQFVIVEFTPCTWRTLKLIMWLCNRQSTMLAIKHLGSAIPTILWQLKEATPAIPFLKMFLLPVWKYVTIEQAESQRQKA